MRHRKKSQRLSRSRAQKKALVKSLLKAMIHHEGIVTTTSRAKYLKGGVEKLITWAKINSLSSRRLAYKTLGDHGLVKKLFDVIGPRFKTIEGGYTRALRLGRRKGDGAELSRIELTFLDKKEKKEKKERKQKAVTPQKTEEKAPPKKDKEPKKGLISGVRKIFKKDRGGSK